MGKYTAVATTQEQFERLVRTIRAGYTYNGIKHRPNDQIATILVLEANLGCRIGDIVALTVESFYNDGGIWKINIKEQKTGKKRYFIVPKPVMEFITKWCSYNDIQRGNLFDITCHAVWKQVRAATAYIGLKDVSTHSMRKMAAQKIFEQTNHDIEAVAEFLNHSSINTSRRYIRRTDEQLERAITNAVSLA